MKKITMNIKQFASVLGGVFLMSLPMGFVSCTEDIDESNFAIKSEMTAADFIESDPKFSMIKSIFLNVRLGASENASPIFSVLTARGNYTLFLPTNDAVEKFIAQEGMASLDELLSNTEKVNLVAKSCIIDHEDNSAKETADFPITGSFDVPNLQDRLLTCNWDAESQKYIINGTSVVIDEDNEVSNGYIHVVDAVVAPSAMTLDRLIGEAGNLKVFSYLLAMTKWDSLMHENLDITYENPERPLVYTLAHVAPFKYAQHRYLGYTALVEPDSIYEDYFGVPVELDEEGNLANGKAFVTAIQNKLSGVYGMEEVDSLSHPDNAVNRFVAYHLLKGKMPYNKILHHYNEYGYQYGSDWMNPQTSNMPTNVWDFYTTMGKHRSLVKFTQIGDGSIAPDVATTKSEHPIYVNRISKYANKYDEDYKELSAVPGFEGILLHATNGEFDNNGLNGYYFPIDDILVYTEEYRSELIKQRIRIDVTTMLPELASNNVRGGEYVRFENGYFENITNESPDTKLLYLHHSPARGLWADYQGDEFMVSGQYDFTLKLPPVPKTGTYEIRMGVAHNNLRGMCQIYFGKNMQDMLPAGLPYDMRQQAEINGKPNPAIPWIKDTDDPFTNAENDRNLRNQGYMKGPQYYTTTNGKGDTPVRTRGGAYATLRRIIILTDMEAGETYYLRFKTALKKNDSQFFMDLFEFAHTSVFNGTTAEDIW